MFSYKQHKPCNRIHILHPVHYMLRNFIMFSSDLAWINLLPQGSWRFELLIVSFTVLNFCTVCTANNATDPIHSVMPLMVIFFLFISKQMSPVV
jgi:hypothetical protein